MALILYYKIAGKGGRQFLNVWLSSASLLAFRVGVGKYIPINQGCREAFLKSTPTSNAESKSDMISISW